MMEIKKFAGESELDWANWEAIPIFNWPNLQLQDLKQIFERFSYSHCLELRCGFRR